MRSHSRSASVLLVPGITIAAASRARRACGRSARARRAARTRRGSRCGAATTIAMRPSPPPAPWSATPSSSGSGTSSHGITPSVGTPVRSSSHSGPGASSAGSPRKRLSRKPASRSRSASERQCHVPEQVRERAAAVDVAAQQHRRRDLERDRHVDDVAVAQVDLGRAARALDHDDVVVVQQPVQRFAHDRPELRAALAPGQCARSRDRPRPARPPASACRPRA